MNAQKKNQIIVVAGPTASGKTNFALNLAKKLNGELINADSRQVYRYMDIGTNKGALSTSPGFIQTTKFTVDKYYLEDSTIPAWGFNLVEPDQKFNVSEYQQMAYELINDMQMRNIVPILVGGTGLYIDAVLKGYSLNNQPANSTLRSELEVLTLKQLQAKLTEIDSQLLENLNNSDKHNPVRLIRLIEKAMSPATEGLNSPIFDYVMYYPEIKRDKLYSRIDLRVEQMLEQGLVTEVHDLIKKGYKDTKPMQGIGYKEIVNYIDGKYNLDKAIELIKQGHRNYASRQITWFEGKGRGYNLTLVEFK